MSDSITTSPRESRDTAITSSPPAKTDQPPSIVKEHHQGFLSIFAFGVVWTAAVIAGFVLFSILS